MVPGVTLVPIKDLSTRKVRTLVIRPWRRALSPISYLKGFDSFFNPLCLEVVPTFHNFVSIDLLIHSANIYKPKDLRQRWVESSQVFTFLYLSLPSCSCFQDFPVMLYVAGITISNFTTQPELREKGMWRPKRVGPRSTLYTESVGTEKLRGSPFCSVHSSYS